MFAYCCCNDACPEINVTRWLNLTQVRKSDGEVITNVDPFARFDPETAAQDHDAGWCAAQPPGTCGRWLIGGGNNAVSEQLVEATVNDILDCAETLRDHNCYQSSGTITRTRGKRGGKWVIGKKSWHGMFGWHDYEHNTDEDQSPPQVKYLTYTHNTAEWSQETAVDVIVTYPEDGYLPIGRYVFQKVEKHADVVRTVNRFTGIISQSGADMRTVTTDYDYSRGSNEFDHSGVIGTGAATVTEVGCDSGGLPADIAYPPYGTNDIPGISDWTDIIATAVTAGATEPTVTSSGWTFDYTWTEGEDDEFTYHLVITISRTNTGYSWNCHMETLVKLYDLDVWVGTTEYVNKYSGSKTLSDPYTAADCYTDLKAAMAAWPLSDDGLYSLRLDEQLANGPLCCYDETPPSEPIGYVCSMDNFDVGLITDSLGREPGEPEYIPTWAQTAWRDERDYLWLFPDGSYVRSEEFETGAELITPLYTGSIISHNPPGSERHFWPAFEGYRREPQLYFGDPTGLYLWVRETFGAFSESPLPEATLRWMGIEQAQYDGLAFTNELGPPLGNMPQGFLRQRSGVLVGGKYVEAKEEWPRMDFSRPNGADKYALDQTTVCCILSTGTGTYTVKATGNAAEPLATGGLAVGNTIIIKADGVYPITDIDDDGTVDDGMGNSWHQFTITVGTKIDDLPTSGIVFGDARDDVDWLGRARWWSAPGIAGRVAITTSHDGTTLTITPGAAQLYLRTGASVDLCDSSMTVLATVTLTRVGDTTFTVVHADVAGAAYMVSHVLYDGSTSGVSTWQLHNAASAHTYVHLAWQQQFRATPPQTWYEDQVGIISVTATQGDITPNSCYGALIAITPSGETFGNGDLFGFPSTFAFDDWWGAVWQAAIETTMVDPFWQTPFKPDCDILNGDSLTWQADDGSGQADYEDGLGPVAHFKFYAYPPLVEALKTVPGGVPALPAGVVLPLDPALTIILPPHSYGVPVDESGGWTSVWRPWGFAITARANIAGPGRFADSYAAFVPDEI